MHICPSGTYHTFHQFRQMKLQNFFDIKARKVHYDMLALGMFTYLPIAITQFHKISLKVQVVM